MCIAADAFPTRDNQERAEGLRDDVAFSTTGLGDGYYDVVVVTAPDGALRGLEVIFLADDDFDSDEFDELATPARLAHPRTQATPESLGTLESKGHLAVGDPCYGEPTITIDVPAGSYSAVIWRDYTTQCVARLGVYLNF